MQRTALRSSWSQTPSLAYQRVEPLAEQPELVSHFTIGLIGTVVAGAGVALAAFLYLGEETQAMTAAPRAVRPLYRLSHGKLFFDQIYQVFIVWPLWLLAQVSYWFDRWVIDGLVNSIGRVPLCDRPRACDRCKAAWCSFTPWRWCGALSC